MNTRKGSTLRCNHTRNYDGKVIPLDRLYEVVEVERTYESNSEWVIDEVFVVLELVDSENTSAKVAERANLNRDELYEHFEDANFR
jgi:hypothetical protein